MPKRLPGVPPAMSYQEQDHDVDWRMPFDDSDWTLITELLKLDAGEIADVVDMAVKEKRDKVLCTKLNSFVRGKRKVEGFKSAGPSGKQAQARHPLLLSPGSNLANDWDKMPVIVNGFDVPQLLFADCEMIVADNLPKSDKMLVVMFSAVKIPKNRGTPVPVLHTIVNYGKAGAGEGQIKPNMYAINKIHGIGEATWKWHMAGEMFVKLLCTFTHKSFLLFWDADQDRIAIRNTFKMFGTDVWNLPHIIDLQAPIQDLLFPKLNAIDNHVHDATKKMSLFNALRAAVELGKEKRWSSEGVMEMMRLVGKLNESKKAGKNSLLDSIAVATIYNYMSHDSDYSFILSTEEIIKLAR